MTSNGLIGPFPMTDPPVRVGWYTIETRHGQSCCWWDGTAWFASDDPLDFTINFKFYDSDVQWYGQAAPSRYHRGGLVDMKPGEVPAILSAGVEHFHIEDDGLEEAP